MNSDFWSSYNAVPAGHKKLSKKLQVLGDYSEIL